MMIYDTSIMHAYDASMHLGCEVLLLFLKIAIVAYINLPLIYIKDLLLPDKIAETASMVRKQFEMEKEWDDFWLNIDDSVFQL